MVIDYGFGLVNWINLAKSQMTIYKVSKVGSKCDCC
jgi:hypothetical protein